MIEHVGTIFLPPRKMYITPYKCKSSLFVSRNIIISVFIQSRFIGQIVYASFVVKFFN